MARSWTESLLDCQYGTPFKFTSNRTRICFTWNIINGTEARPLLALETSELQLEAAEIVIEDLSARDAEELVKRLLETLNNLNHRLNQGKIKGYL